MRGHPPENERIKRQYLTYLEEAKRMSVKRTDQIAAAIAPFEILTKFKDFRQFHIEQARKFKSELSTATDPITGNPLVIATVLSGNMASTPCVRPRS